MTADDMLQPVDDAARRLAKSLLRGERTAALGTLETATGGPQVTRVSVATAMAGQPLFLISSLSPHFGALEADSRASLLLGTPGKGDPLAHARITVFGRAHRLDGEARGQARCRFLRRHPKAALYADFTDFAFWVLEPERASLNGGFAKAYAPTAGDLLTEISAEVEGMEEGAVSHMNEDHGDAIKLYAEVLLGQPPGDWQLACIDPDGLDLVCGDRVARLWFDTPLSGPEALRPMLVDLAKRARAAQS